MFSGVPHKADSIGSPRDVALGPGSDVDRPPKWRLRCAMAGPRRASLAKPANFGLVRSLGLAQTRYPRSAAQCLTASQGGFYVWAADSVATSSTGSDWRWASLHVVVGVVMSAIRWSNGCAKSFKSSTSKTEDFEHPDVSLKHETEWCLSAFLSGLLIWENVGDVSEDADPIPEGELVRHMKGVSRQKVLELWLKLAAGDIPAVDAEPWLPGSH
jgi:hypothetical protein